MGLTGCGFALLTAGSVAYAVDRGGRALKTSGLLLFATWAFSVTIGSTLVAGNKPYVYAWVDGMFAGAVGVMLTARFQRWRAGLFALAILQMFLHLAMIGIWDFSLAARRLHVFSLNLTYALELFVLTIGAAAYRPGERDDVPEIIEVQHHIVGKDDGTLLYWLECVDKARRPVL
ncbi:hypothetical protein HOT99_gp125 [Caulobacter phage CcrBL10]|uniref:Uncharacterized protein n=1 Tax=Caulobacter phage CcrBL10 TaxID=2283269 RepID=A0A385ECA0_9CAUD|nr:hypothetical protein HOT99_gp125 [Caulobacter phage CcrBL10]AXQ68492.1 hypothetical protein CcrBL10_gp288 [Caulobacter phage CcrBL10]